MERENMRDLKSLLLLLKIQHLYKKKKIIEGKKPIIINKRKGVETLADSDSVSETQYIPDEIIEIMPRIKRYKQELSNDFVSEFYNKKDILPASYLKQPNNNHGFGNFKISNNPKPSNKVVCDICGKAIAKWNLQFHMNIHLNLKPFACDYEGCDKKFASFASLYSHKKIHENIRPFRCDKCTAAFLTGGALRKHTVYHYPPTLECQECGKMCHNKTRLNIHIEKYHTVGEFLCTQPNCIKVFTHRFALRAHMRKTHNIRMITHYHPRQKINLNNN